MDCEAGLWPLMSEWTQLLFGPICQKAGGVDGRSLGDILGLAHCCCCRGLAVRLQGGWRSLGEILGCCWSMQLRA